VLADRIGVPGAGGDRFPAPTREADVNERTDTGTMDPHGRGDEGVERDDGAPRPYGPARARRRDSGS